MLKSERKNVKKWKKKMLKSESKKCWSQARWTSWTPGRFLLQPLLRVQVTLDQPQSLFYFVCSLSDFSRAAQFMQSCVKTFTIWPDFVASKVWISVDSDSVCSVILMWGHFPNVSGKLESDGGSYWLLPTFDCWKRQKGAPVVKIYPLVCPNAPHECLH